MAPQHFFIGWDNLVATAVLVGTSILASTAFLTALYRLIWHPLAGIPGPKIAAITGAYEFWFEVVRQGRYTHEVKRMHDQYGPLVRISPNEVHCNDLEFIETIYASGKQRRDKSLHFVRGFSPSLQMKAGVATASHELHRTRRGAVNKAFSRARILGLEGLVRENVMKLCDKILAEGRQPFNVALAYSCLTTDVITEYTVGESHGCLDCPGWAATLKSSVDVYKRYILIFRFFPMLANIMEKIPARVLGLLHGGAGTIANDIQVVIPSKVKRAMEMPGVAVGQGCPTILSTLLESQLPESELSMQRLTGEIMAILVGGTESPSVVLERLTYFVLSNPDIHKRLHSEISGATKNGSTIPSWQDLEQLPFLGAIILESLRLMYGVSGRAPRVAPDEDLIYTRQEAGCKKAPSASAKSYIIPRGSEISMSCYLMHTNEAIWPDPDKFIPGRWLDSEGNLDRSLERYLLTFSKGSRNCVGIQLAYCELYVCAAALVLRVFPRLKLYETTWRDVKYDHDALLAMPAAGTNGVRAVVVD